MNEDDTVKACRFAVDRFGPRLLHIVREEEDHVLGRVPGGGAVWYSGFSVDGLSPETIRYWADIRLALLFLLKLIRLGDQDILGRTQKLAREGSSSSALAQA